MTLASKHGRTAALCLCLACAVLCAPVTAGAEPTAGEKETARSLMEQGMARMEVRDYAAALKAFSTANEIMHVPTTALQTARAHAALLQLVEARDRALEAARYPQRPGEPPVFSQARYEATALAASLGPRIPAVEITVKGPPRGASVQVVIDSRLLRPAALAAPYKLNPGSHRLTASSPGFEPAHLTVHLSEKQLQRITLELLPQPTTVAGPNHEPAAGVPPPARDYTLAYVGFGVGAAGVLTGAVTGALALSKQSSLKSQCDEPSHTCPSSAKADLDSGRRLVLLSNVGFGVGIVGIGIGVGALLWPRAEPASQGARTGTRLRPVAGASSVGMEVAGWF
jgi:hypothetical protein